MTYTCINIQSHQHYALLKGSRETIEHKDPERGGNAILIQSKVENIKTKNAFSDSQQLNSVVIGKAFDMYLF